MTFGFATTFQHNVLNWTKFLGKSCCCCMVYVRKKIKVLIAQLTFIMLITSHPHKSRQYIWQTKLWFVIWIFERADQEYRSNQNAHIMLICLTGLVLIHTLDFDSSISFFGYTNYWQIEESKLALVKKKQKLKDKFPKKWLSLKRNLILIFYIILEKDRTFSHDKLSGAKKTTLKIKLKIAFSNLRYGRQPGGVWWKGRWSSKVGEFKHKNCTTLYSKQFATKLIYFSTFNSRYQDLIKQQVLIHKNTEEYIYT